MGSLKAFHHLQRTYAERMRPLLDLADPDRGRLSCPRSLRRRPVIPLAGALPDQLQLELGDHGEDLPERLRKRVAPVHDLLAEVNHTPRSAAVEDLRRFSGPARTNRFLHKRIADVEVQLTQSFDT